jgi:hypothetical protein
MDLPLLTIESALKKGGPSKGGVTKTRSFSVHLLGFLSADPLWDPGGDRSAGRPVWLAYLGTESETQAFTANLRAGRKARVAGDVLELGKRRYRWAPPQKVPNGIVTIAYLPELFHLEPTGPLSEEVRFVFAPASWWIAEQTEELAGEFGEDAPAVARAALFCAYLDRRSPLPLVHDLHFHLQVYQAALETGWIYPLSTGRGAVLRGRGAEAAGLDAPVACSVNQKELTEFLIQQTALYHEEIRLGTTRVAAGGRLLS